ncbi:MAG: DUF2141 domain-containing protein [Xanthomonadales bacterium]|nr:DUF2141 domain-containing protein [Xanthomonadales bacterium]
MTTRTALAFTLFVLVPQLTWAELPGIRLTVTGADPATGTIEATLFTSAETFLTEAHLQQSGEVAEDGTFSAEFAGLEEGEYAIVVVHDANENGVFDAGLFGFGGESVGYSNNASSWLGRPSFDDAKFTVEDSELEILINLD